MEELFAELVVGTIATGLVAALIILTIKWPRGMFNVGAVASFLLLAGITWGIADLLNSGSGGGRGVPDFSFVGIVVLGILGLGVVVFTIVMGIVGLGLTAGAAVEKDPVRGWVVGTVLYFLPTALLIVGIATLYVQASLPG